MSPNQHRMRGRTAGILLTAALLVARPAAAGINLAGAWRFDTAQITLYGTFTQAGTVLGLVLQSGPVSVALQDASGLHRGTTSTCTTNAAGSLRCR